jgi:hypothetical protein
VRGQGGRANEWRRSKKVPRKERERERERERFARGNSCAVRSYVCVHLYSELHTHADTTTRADTKMRIHGRTRAYVSAGTPWIFGLGFIRTRLVPTACQVARRQSLNYQIIVIYISRLLVRVRSGRESVLTFREFCFWQRRDIYDYPGNEIETRARQVINAPPPRILLGKFARSARVGKLKPRRGWGALDFSRRISLPTTPGKYTRRRRERVPVLLCMHAPSTFSHGMRPKAVLRSLFTIRALMQMEESGMRVCSRPIFLLLHLLLRLLRRCRPRPRPRLRLWHTMGGGGGIPPATAARTPTSRVISMSNKTRT